MRAPARPRAHAVLGTGLALALAWVASAAAAESPDGARVFGSNCMLCHGEHGEGNGRAARSLATPPANLTRSQLDAAAIRQIVTLGGAAVGRSSSMPPWGEALTPADIDAVVSHVCTLAGGCAPSPTSRAQASSTPPASH